MKKLWVFIVVFSFTAVTLSTFFKSEYLTYSHNFFGGITSNLKETAYAFDGILKGKHLKEENENLKKQLSENKSIQAENDLLKKENQELYQLLKLNKEAYGNNVVNAQVKKVNTVADFSLTVDKGTHSGVKAGDICVWGKAIVGRVTESFDDFSVVTPITAPNSTVGIINSKGDAGVISGNLSLCNKNMCEISFFSDTAKVENHEIIVTSGLSDIYPKGLTVGKIEKEKNTTLLLTEVDFFKIRTVSLISSR